MLTNSGLQRAAARSLPRQLLVFIHQRRQRSRLIAGQHKLTAQALFCHANGRNIHQQAKMAGDARFRDENPVAIDKEQVWFLCELLPAPPAARVFHERRENQDLTAWWWQRAPPDTQPVPEMDKRATRNSRRVTSPSCSKPTSAPPIGREDHVQSILTNDRRGQLLLPFA